MTLKARGDLTLVTKLVAAGVSYAFAILLARLMAPAAFGQVVLFLNGALLLSVAGAAGQQMALVRFIPTLGADQRAAAASLFRLAARRAAAVTLVLTAAALLVVLTTRQAGPFSELPPGALVLGMMLVPAVGAMDLLAHLARAQHRIQLSIIPKEIAWRVVAGAMIAAAWLITSGPVPTSVALLALVASATLATAFLIWKLLSSITQGPHTNHLAGVQEPWRRAARPFWITSLANVFLVNADVLVVGVLLGPAPAGLYFAANRLALLLSFPAISRNHVIAPALAGAWSTGEHGRFAAILDETVLRTGVVTLAGAVILGAGAPWAVGVFGPEFSGAATALQLLCLAAVVNAAVGPAELVLNMAGQEVAAMRANVGSMLIGAVLLVIGAVWLGINGVAAAVATATVLRKAIFWQLSRQHLGIRTDMAARRRARPDPAPAKAAPIGPGR